MELDLVQGIKNVGRRSTAPAADAKISTSCRNDGDGVPDASDFIEEWNPMLIEDEHGYERLSPASFQPERGPGTQCHATFGDVPVQDAMPEMLCQTAARHPRREHDHNPGAQ